MAPPAGTCDLCDEPAPHESRNHGFDLCERCTAGHLSGRLDHIGAQLTVEEVEREHRGNVYLELAVSARMPGALPINASFSGATLGKRLLGLVRGQGKRVRTGDPLFDARIQVETTTGALLQTLLRNDGFQSAVMALVGACGPWSIRPGAIDLRADLEDLDLRAEVPLAVACVLRHMANHA